MLSAGTKGKWLGEKRGRIGRRGYVEGKKMGKWEVIDNGRCASGEIDSFHRE